MSNATFHAKVTVCADLAEITSTARAQILSIIGACPADRQVSLALSGGSTPKNLYESLHEHDLALLRNQKRVLFFLGDERLYLSENELSNLNMATKALLRDVPADCVLPVEAGAAVATSEDPVAGEAGARVVAKAYEEELLKRLPVESVAVDGAVEPVQVPVADIVLLGFGSDGHTASVFPYSVAASDTAAAMSVSFPSPTMNPKVWRVSLTPLAINRAKHVIILAAGKDKQWVIDGILSDTAPAGDAYPVARFLRQCTGQVHFILDRESAGNAKL